MKLNADTYTRARYETSHEATILQFIRYIKELPEEQASEIFYDITMGLGDTLRNMGYLNSFNDYIRIMEKK